MVETVTVILLVFFVYYLAFLWDVRRGLSLLASPSATARPAVSVILPARNEATSI